MSRRTQIGSAILLSSILGTAGALTAWKQAAVAASANAAASQPEYVETITSTLARTVEHRPTTTAIGTVLALRSITLRNELPGTVRSVALQPGEIVDAGTVLVALDVSVEQAELAALQAQGALAASVLERNERLHKENAVSREELDRARADRDVANAQIARTRAIIERKTIRAPFRARVGIADVHPGQYLQEGTQLTTLQGVDDAVHVDFSVEQAVAEQLVEGEQIEVIAGKDRSIAAHIVAIDARVDPATRNAMIRARIADRLDAPSPGASVRVQVPAGASRTAVGIPASALRKGPAGDHVFVVSEDDAGMSRAHLRTVEVIAQSGDDVVIGKGLVAGERIAASGSFKLREDVLVALADNASGGKSGAGR